MYLNIYTLSLAGLIPLSSMLITSCSPRARNNIPNQTNVEINAKKTIDMPTNIHKQLNRVQCISPENCTDDVLSQIWYACIRNGYTTSSPATEVISGREIRELIEPEISITETRYRSTTYTDQYGVVTNTVVPDKESKTYRKKSYCIGNEYITKPIREK